MGRKPDTTMTAEERLAQIRAKNAEYARKWRAKNPEKQAANARRYWSKRLEELKQTSGQQDTDTNE